MASGRDEQRTATIVKTFAGFRAGNDGAIATVRAWAEVIVRGGTWRFSDPDGVVQDTLLKLLGLAAAGKVRDPESFQKFVYTVAKNTCVTVYHRERTRRRHEEAVAEYDEPAEPAQGLARLEQAERAEMLSEIVQRLPESCRRLWDRIYYERKKPDEVAAELGISPGNLRVRVHRCTEKAREIHRALMLDAGAERDA